MCIRDRYFSQNWWKAFTLIANNCKYKSYLWIKYHDTLLLLHSAVINIARVLLVWLLQVLLVASRISIYLHIICARRNSQIHSASKSWRVVSTKYGVYLMSALDLIAKKLLQCCPLIEQNCCTWVYKHLLLQTSTKLHVNQQLKSHALPLHHHIQF